MGVNKRNSEGYYDPTAYEALTKVIQETEGINTPVRNSRFRPLVYICSPYAGDIERNCEYAKNYCRYAVRTGHLPIAPHIYFTQFMDDSNPTERSTAMFMDLVLLSKCHELWVFGNRLSEGMSIEISNARERGKTIRYFTENCEEVTR